MTRQRRSALKILFAAYNKGSIALFASLYAAVNMPGEFHQAAAMVYERLAHFKDTTSPELEDVLSSMV